MKRDEYERRMARAIHEEAAADWAEIADQMRGMSDAGIRHLYTRPRRDLIRDAQNEAARRCQLAQEATE